MKKYVYSLGLLATHHALTRATLCAICAEIRESETTLHVENARNLSAIRALGKIKLSPAAWDDRPRENIEYTRWAFEQFGLKIA